MRRTGAIMWGPLVGCGTVEAPEVPAQEVGGLVATYDAGVVWLRRGATSEVGLSAVGPAVPPVRVGGRTEYRRQRVTEWWQAVPWGLEQGFDVAAPPHGKLVLELALTGAVAEVDANGEGATLRTASDETLRYERLAAWDERRVKLPARMEPTDRGLRLVVDTTDAVGAVTVDPLVPAPDWSVESNHAGAQYGSSVASAGDVNGDGKDDWIVGAMGYAPGGEAFVYLGSAGALPLTASSTLTTALNQAALGISVASAGDVDGDGRDDVIVGAAYARQRGEAYVYRGTPLGLRTSPAWTLAVADTQTFGESVASAGDVNGDGYDDVIVGASNADDLQPPGVTVDGGAAFVFLGSAGGLSVVPAWSELGAESSLFFGDSVASAGDVNGDGYDDVVVGEPGNSDLEFAGGAASVYLGSAAGPSAQPAWKQRSDLRLDRFGQSVASAGDVDGDGFDDVVVGGVGASLYLGSPSGLSTVAAWSVDAGGTSVASAGDVNGDGYDDLVLGSGDPGFPVIGSTVWLGSALGVSLKPIWRGSDDNTSSVASAGDVNGDGYDDVLLGSSLYQDPEVQEGLAYMYLGGATSDADGDTVPDPVDLCPQVSESAILDSDGDEVGNACDDPVRVTVHGTVAPGAAVVLVASGVGAGETVSFAQVLGAGGVGPCPAALGGLCLDLGPAATAAGTAVADGTGTARLATTVPGALQPGGPWSLQASVARGAGGNSSVKSALEVLDGTVIDWDSDGLVDADEALSACDVRNPDTDGDGLQDGEDGLPWFDPTDPDSDGDGLLDGADACPAGSDLADADGDGFADACDVCPKRYDPAQLDSDGDGDGDLCPLLVGPAWETGPLEPLSRVGAGGDLNGDGFDEVWIESAVGGAGMYLGSPTGISHDLYDWSPISSPQGISAWGPVGDVDGDGFDDVVATLSTYDGALGNEGAAYLYRGVPAGLSTVAAWTATGTRVGEGYGTWYAPAGDVNGDGYADVLVGAVAFRVDLYLGSAAGLAASPDWTRTAADAWIDQAQAGDLNGDGYDDVVFRDLPGADQSSLIVYLGSPTGLGAVPDQVLGSTAAVRFDGSVATGGDVNGDGFDDVVVGDSEWEEANLLLGTPTGLSTTAAWTGVDDEPGSEFGFAVAVVEDLDGDGLDEVAVGAPDHGTQGAVSVFLGTSSGLTEDLVWRQAGRYDGERFGRSVGGSGDVYGDGTRHLLVGSGFDVHTMPGRARLYESTAGLDADGDGVLDVTDVCPQVADPAQLDTDGDGTGNACDAPMLAVEGAVSPGQPVTLFASGAGPGEKVWFAGSAGGVGVGPCGPRGECLDLGGDTVLLGTAIADAAGEAREVVNVPAGLAAGPYAAQAVILRPASSVWSEAVVVDVP